MQVVIKAEKNVYTLGLVLGFFFVSVFFFLNTWFYKCFHKERASTK